MRNYPQSHTLDSAFDKPFDSFYSSWSNSFSSVLSHIMLFHAAGSSAFIINILLVSYGEFLIASRMYLALWLHTTKKECGVSCSHFPMEQHNSYILSSVYPEESSYSVITIYFILSNYSSHLSNSIMHDTCFRNISGRHQTLPGSTTPHSLNTISPSSLYLLQTANLVPTRVPAEAW